MAKLWSGRFQKDTSQLMEDFHSSIAFDQKLYKEDIRGSIAHARMLGDVGVITAEEAALLCEGLASVQEDIEAGRVVFDARDEDIHMNVERLLTEKIGATGKKLHTGRSRNDQVALDLKMYVRQAVVDTQALACDLIDVLLKKARQYQHTIMPGYTHLQRAQPITFAHHLMAYVEMCKRDILRLDQWLLLHNASPLGSGALAGTTYPLDRQRTAHELGFSDVMQNSLDGVSDRDFVLDYLYAASVSMVHLSRLCEEIILWSSQEFAFVELDDAYSTGSSIMPQKKNPDVAELVRGKSGRVVGHLMGLLMTMKGLPLAYNKDMQEDKEGLFDTVDTWQKCLLIMAPLLDTLTVKEEQTKAAAAGGFTNATDLADYLVKKSLPFRDAHKVVGELVALCIRENLSLDQLSLETYRNASDLIEEDVYDAIDIKTCVDKRNTEGGPGEAALDVALSGAEVWLKARNA